ncbi:tetratricopeptide repeat protein [Mucilaginibacter paludis]|uniref:Uncharacterized protein n=1 Tax=Mucilaginibacter paludis DSM 18603 TaxID=714943 RepID=H1YC63_9SPHI|nr:tetratricopeptide repeat protein [Mucilaginibacter paludis]EHQ29626.1 hypothetical protein Mucpa_5555 [Mucilaginibacter paludis DSM 18603]
MLKLRYLSLLLLFGTSTFAQNNPKRKADSLYQAKNYPAAGRYYLLAANVGEFKASKRNEYYNAACCYALSGKADSAIALLNKAIENGYKDGANLKVDADLTLLHTRPEWAPLLARVEKMKTGTNDPLKVKLVTTDIKNFWRAYDLAQKDTAHRIAIYKKYYVDAGTAGLQDYFALKVGSVKNFVDTHDGKPKFYAAIRKNTLMVDEQKPEMIASFVKLKQLYPAANFPDVYFVMGAFTSGGTSTDNGLLIGLDQSVRTPDIPIGELTLWQNNNFGKLSGLPGMIAHELIHFNQGGLKRDTSLLCGVLVEGMADFIGELISGHSINERLQVWAKGKEQRVWADFEKEMYLKRNYNWIANSNQETADKPADLGYWVGYQICKAYYDKSTDKAKAINDMLNIKDCKAFYEESGAHNLFKNAAN